MADLDSLIHQPTRLRVMAALASLVEGERLDFTDLQMRLQLTPGNLTIHIQKLEGAQYLAVEKIFVGRRPKTWIKATEKGREALAQHVLALEEIIRQETDTE
ncbi:MAG: transcriptional regulator [Candidatus Latescibacteria bacterium]|nr:transcriptional regulator [Candidatus Latescibacterota bacterium]